MGNLADTLGQLYSSKVGERQDGLAGIKSVLSKPKVIANFHIRRDGTADEEAWKRVFKAVFAAVDTETTAYGKHSSKAAIVRRLGELTGFVRTLTDMSVTYLGKDTLLTILQHISSHIHQNGDLFAPVAADYIKVLRALFRYQPHADNITHDQWVDLAGMSFNIILNEPVTQRLEVMLEEEDEEASEGAEEGVHAEDSDAEAGNGDTLSPLKKRKRGASAGPTQGRANKARGHTPTGTQLPRLSSRTPQVSTEQIECMAFLSFLLALPKAPIIHKSHTGLPATLLQRFRRFLQIYPYDTSLHADYLASLSSVLSQVALNHKRAVSEFSKRTWVRLASLWGTKNKALKEGLVAVLTVLLPYYTTSVDPSKADGLEKLCNSLGGLSHNKWGCEGLALDALRLVTARDDTRSLCSEPFLAHVFRAGMGFTSSQALAWAVHELHADVLAKLYTFSENAGIRSTAKRGKTENALSQLLSSIQTQSSLRSYRLQLLLFLIDRHWFQLHSSFQSDVFSTLLQSFTYDDPEIQSWVYLCLAAIAYAEGSRANAVTDTQAEGFRLIKWEPVWTHAMRRATVPIVCRSACHLAYILLVHSIRPPSTSSHEGQTAPQGLISSPRVLAEIEVLLKDLDVQGPSAPYDAVCIFLSESLKVASQDVRLYRMQLEEKVLNWLIDCWKLGSTLGLGLQARRSTAEKKASVAPINALSDVMSLLESICGLSKGSQVVSRISLPACWITELLVDQAKSRVIRDFLLDAKLPPFVNSLGQHSPDILPSASLGEARYSPDTELIQPNSRQRKLSTFFLKALDGLTAEWDGLVEEKYFSDANTTRTSIDFAVAALCCEFSLNLNGVRPNRRTVQLACKVFQTVARWLNTSKWPLEEKASIIRGLEPLWDPNVQDADEGQPWVAMLRPDIGSGIRAQALRRLSARESHKNDSKVGEEYRRIMWQSADIQDAFGKISETFKELFRATADDYPSVGQADLDKDGFESNHSDRIVGTESSRAISGNSPTRHIFRACVTFLTFVPVLQSSSGEATRDRDFVELVIEYADSSPEKFMLIFPSFLSQIRSQVLTLHVNNLTTLLVSLGNLLTSYEFQRNPTLIIQLILLLDATLAIWAPVIADRSLASTLERLLKFVADALLKAKFPTWQLRDAAACFIARYLSFDPKMESWSQCCGESFSPLVLLPLLGQDGDIRVRFRVAAINAGLFVVASQVDHSTTQLYETIRGSLSKVLSEYEPMLTRLLCLANIMVVSSAVRRGAYWHLIEICLHTEEYNRHIDTILKQVAQRMGLSSLSDIFEIYASQLAFSICEGGYDILRFPPHLLGYADRKESAQAAFKAFAPSNLLGGAQHGLSLFRGHCKVLQKSEKDGITECFGDIVGNLVVAWFAVNDDTSSHRFVEQLRVKCQMSEDADTFDALLKQNVDGIVAAILRTLGDQDFSKDGQIHSSIASALGQSQANQFSRLNQYRRHKDFAAHTPNLPVSTTVVVLKALSWCNNRLPGCEEPAITFHVLHALLADINRSPLVNEQIRLANALTLWVSLRDAHFKEYTLLHTLAQGAASLMKQFDMVGLAQSILDWCFEQYRNNLLDDDCLPDILIQLCYQAYDFDRESSSSPRSLGKKLLTWIDHQATLFCRSPIHHKQVLRALPSWSHPLSKDLSVYYEEIQANTLSDIISDRRISSNKFRLVRRLRDLAVEGDSDITRFGTADFWRLKECIPEAEKLQDDDVHAFISLLTHYQGRIDGIGMSHPETSYVRTKHCLSDSTSEDGSPKSAILYSLLTRLDSANPVEVHLTYTTLRLLVASSRGNIVHQSIWSPLQINILGHFQVCMPTPHQGTGKHIGRLTESSYSDTFSDFRRWVTSLTTLLSDILATRDIFYAQLTPILSSDADIAEQFLPVLVHTLLESPKFDKTTKAEYRHRLTDYFSTVLKTNDTSPRCLSAIVDTALHLRHFTPVEEKAKERARRELEKEKRKRPPAKAEKADPIIEVDALAHDKWLDIDYFLLARSSAKCGAYATALLFLELASEYNITRPPSESEEILYDIYGHIDEPDGFYGIKPSDHRQFLLRRFHHEGQWSKAFRFHGASLEAFGYERSTIDGLLRSYHSFGFNQLAISTLQSNPTAPSSAGMTYRLGWRTETWDLPDQICDQDQLSVYAALRAVHREREPLSIQSTIRQSLSYEMNKLRNLGVENHAEVRDVIQNLMCLDQVVRWRAPSTQARLSARQIDEELWAQFTNAETDFQFLDLENMMFTRVSLVRSARLKAERAQIGTMRTPFLDELTNLERSCLIRLSEASRQFTDGQIALNAITRAQKLDPASNFAVAIEFAQVLWLQKEEKAAVQLLREVLAAPEAKVPSQRAVLLAHLGTWTAEACLEKPTAILSQYFGPAVALIEDVPSGSFDPTHADIFHRCAMFAERQYRHILKSPDGERLEAFAKSKAAEVETRHRAFTRASDSATKESLYNELTKAKKVLEADTQVFEAHVKARDSFLLQAIDMYSRCLASSSEFDDDGALRLCTLWFANFDLEHLQDTIETALDRIPSFKFVFLVHQLTSRLSQSTSDSQSTPRHQSILRNLILRMCAEHPYHTLYQVLFLSPQQSAKALSARRSSGRIAQQTDTLPSTQVQRSEAAHRVLDVLRNSSNQEQLNRLQSIQKLFDASLQWALYAVPKDQDARVSHPIPPKYSISSLQNPGAPVITAPLSLDPTLKYDDVILVTKFDTSYTLAGGVNLPKITDCFGSDGRRYKQLFKGNDDLRQDAVMEQVFELVNIVLRRDRQTKRRSLRVRGYKIIPLGPQAGVLEFVGNTTPLHGWLNPAHVRYRPTDLTPAAFRSKLSTLQQRSKDRNNPNAMFAEMQRCRERFKPVMRHWFTEQHKVPTSWMSARLRYTRSVATTSIVGHILGLGDRHVGNILIEKGTGELIHIDLGIAFEQGKLLPIPERVPFRMTPDMVDGMGTSGTQGVFQRCAEETLRVLRERSQVILTVLEVFKYDPLHSWTVSERKFQQAQHLDRASSSGQASTPSASNQVNTANSSNMVTLDLADRVLSSVTRKLDKTMSVEYEVNQLLADATDTTNLACMYYGWSPYL